MAGFCFPQKGISATINKSMAHHELSLLLRGILVGIILALPTGPAGFIVIRQGIVNGYRRGITTALGNLTTDLFYSIVVCFSIGWIASFLLKYHLLFRFSCGLALMVIGIGAWRNRLQEPILNTRNAFRSYLESFAVSVSNPIIIVSSTVLFSAIGGPILISARSLKYIFVIGIMIGGFSWWALTLKVVELLRVKGKMPSLEIINKLSAAVIGISGAGIFAWSFVKIVRVGLEYRDFIIHMLHLIGPFIHNSISSLIH